VKVAPLPEPQPLCRALPAPPALACDAEAVPAWRFHAPAKDAESPRTPCRCSRHRFEKFLQCHDASRRAAKSNLGHHLVPPRRHAVVDFVREILLEKIRRHRRQAVRGRGSWFVQGVAHSLLKPSVGPKSLRCCARSWSSVVLMFE
jgi:hypothetical protein